MSWWKLIAQRTPKPPPSRFHSGAWRRRGPYTGTKPVSELRPPYEWLPEKKK